MTALVNSMQSNCISDSQLEQDEDRVRKWKELIERRTGVVIPQERSVFLATGLRARMRIRGITDYDEYYEILSRSQCCTEEWSYLIDRLTVHETSFFRHEPSLALLRDEVLLNQAVETQEGSKSFQAWSVGCSTGEETYTLAMVIDRYLTSKCTDKQFGVIGTDISKPAIKTAHRGIYSARRIANVAEDYRKDYFEELESEEYQISDHLRRRVCFSQMNIIQADAFPLYDLNLIFCQNMLIYFSREKRVGLLSIISERLAAGGVLVLGPGDVLTWSHPDFERIRFEGTLAFRRRK